MFVLANFIGAIASILNMIITLFIWLFIIRALISWVSPDPYNPIVQFLRRATEPVLGPIRNIVSLRSVPIDFSPLLAILILYFLRYFIVRSLVDLSLRLR
jgi:YggT family protein